MIKIDFKNILSDKVGLRNGIGKTALNHFLVKNQPLVKFMFDHKDEAGYNFLTLPENKALADEINKFASDEKKKKWENIVVLGIGGSALGGIALQEAIAGTYHWINESPRLFFADNIDPNLVTDLLNVINLKKTLFVVISKSGGTVEPMALYSFFRKELENLKVKEVKKHFIFVTDSEKGILRPIGKKEGIRMFSVPEKVGGRFSVLSEVGLIPAALAGIDIKKLMKGADKMKEIIRKSKGDKNPALLLASIQYLMDRRHKKPITVMMPYSNRLFRFGDWYRQLLAESLGKNKKTGPTPVTALGTTDQHSQLQLYNQGPEDKFFIFLQVLKNTKEPVLGKSLPKELSFLNSKKFSQLIAAALKGTSGSLTKNKRPNLTLEIEKIDEESMGALFILFECQVALLGLLYKVDAFSQPGVEESKHITKKILSAKK